MDRRCDRPPAPHNVLDGLGVPYRLPSVRSEEHTSELQSQSNLVCRLLLEKKKIHSSQRSVRPATAGAAPLNRRTTSPTTTRRPARSDVASSSPPTTNATLVCLCSPLNLHT